MFRKFLLEACFGGKECTSFARKLIAHSFEKLNSILQAWSEGFISHFHKEQFLYLAQIKSYLTRKDSADNFWSAQGIKIAPPGNANWCLLNILAKYFQLFETMCYQFFFAERTLFSTKTHFSNEFSQHCWQEAWRWFPLLANQNLAPMLLALQVVYSLYLETLSRWLLQFSLALRT